MAVATANFDSWLNTKLQELKTDESVFSTYIKGILEDCETEDEKAEALEGILAGITEDNITKHVTEILEAWAKWGQVEDVPVNEEPKEDVDVRLVRMLESQSLPTTSHKSHYTEEEKRIREAILAQYSQMSDEDASEGECEDNIGGGGGGGAGAGGDTGLEKNTNVANIVQAEKEKRERAKQESLKKKEKDKEDREKQKLLKDEKKEKRKTVKGERRR